MYMYYIIHIYMYVYVCMYIYIHIYIYIKICFIVEISAYQRTVFQVLKLWRVDCYAKAS